MTHHVGHLPVPGFPAPSTPPLTIGVEALHRLLSRTTPLLPEQQRCLDTFKDWLTGRGGVWVEDQDMSAALAWLTGLDARTTREHLGAFVGPLLVWATSQPWVHEVRHARALSVWCNQHFLAQSKINPKATCTAALDSIVRWQPKLPSFLGRVVALHAMLDVDQKMNWNVLGGMASITPREEWHIAQQLAHLASTYPDYSGTGGMSLLARWEYSMAQYACGQAMHDQVQWIEWLLTQSTMDASYKLHACTKTLPAVWLSTEIQPQLAALLPTDELQRFSVLPWANPDAPTWNTISPDRAAWETNQAMMRRFCPVSESILNCVTTPHDWEHRDAIAALMKQLHNPASQRPGFSLPDNFDNEP